MQTLVMILRRGTGAKGGRIWIIIGHDGVVKSLMGVVVIYKTRIAMAAAYDQGSAQARLLSINEEMKKGDGASARKENKVELRKMAPPRGSVGGTGQQGKREDRDGNGKRVATWGQLQAQDAIEAFEDCIPFISRLAMENMEKALWDQVKAKPIEEVREEVDGRVSDPGSTVGRVSSHDHMVMIY